jgi:hypothetical protein
MRIETRRQKNGFSKMVDSRQYCWVINIDHAYRRRRKRVAALRSSLDRARGILEADQRAFRAPDMVAPGPKQCRIDISVVSGRAEFKSPLLVVCYSHYDRDDGYRLLANESPSLLVSRYVWIVTRLPALNLELSILLLLLVAKISYEQFGGSVPGSEAASGGPVIVDAHLYGALGGILGALLEKFRAWSRRAI